MQVWWLAQVPLLLTPRVTETAKRFEDIKVASGMAPINEDWWVTFIPAFW